MTLRLLIKSLGHKEVIRLVIRDAISNGINLSESILEIAKAVRTGELGNFSNTK